MRSSDWLRPLALGAALVVHFPAEPQSPPYESPPERLPRVLAPQPVPFDHRLHAANRIACTDCHRGASAGERAGLPDRDLCMLCHQSIATARGPIKQLAAMPAGSRIDWVRAYRLPDIVFFSHAEHASAGIDCEACHGPVSSRPVLNQEVSISMVSCMNCHAQRQASNECFVCHDLGQ